MANPALAGGSRSTTPHTPQLSFDVLDCVAEPHAAGPTMRFSMAAASSDVADVRSVVLNIQLNIRASRRTYSSAEVTRLYDVLGPRARWSDSSSRLHWANAVVNVPPFVGRQEFAVLIPCTYDMDVASTRYLHALEDGHIPLEILFSGSVFYVNGDGALQTSRISWDSECRHRLPLSAWRQMMEQHFPGGGWLRLRRETIDLLAEYRTAHALPSWESAVLKLLDSGRLRMEE